MVFIAFVARIHTLVFNHDMARKARMVFITDMARILERGFQIYFGSQQLHSQYLFGFHITSYWLASHDWFSLSTWLAVTHWFSQIPWLAFLVWFSIYLWLFILHHGPYISFTIPPLWHNYLFMPHLLRDIGLFHR